MGYRPKFDCLCPFYITDTEKRIQCEGTTGLESIKLIFETEEDKLKFIKKNCTHDNPEGCDLYQILIKKYI